VCDLEFGDDAQGLAVVGEAKRQGGGIESQAAAQPRVQATGLRRANSKVRVTAPCA